MRFVRFLALGLLIGGCAKDDIDIHTPGTDYNRKGLLAAIDTFTAAGRTPAAYGALAAELQRLEPGMDETVADEAELQLDVLALAPIEQTRALSPHDRAQQLATTVWSVAMQGPVVAPDPASGPSDAGTPARPDEAPDAYMERLCGGVLAIECNFVVPESQAEFVEAAAVRRLAGRTKHVIEECQPCASDPGWARAATEWEQLELQTHAAAAAIVAKVSPDRWPTAGRAASAWSGAPVLDVADNGLWALDGAQISPNARGAGLEAAHAASDTIDVQIGPGVRADVLAALIDAAGSAGFREVDVEARQPSYPWDLRSYRFAAGGARGKTPPWRAVDTVQVLLRSIDAHEEAGSLTHL